MSKHLIRRVGRLLFNICDGILSLMLI
ncbi:hypothetical protein D4764_10G0007660 [Takifugu flavidus]|uniref:Uncharacterized protein n=1 Tax=Takifugu flavidus TaxID=433684 RepID=A0A5C6PLE9_9TELE|nr:hypothetical protein D4764_10G0007660 [Takifugu flavidus]